MGEQAEEVGVVSVKMTALPLGSHLGNASGRLLWRSPSAPERSQLFAGFTCRRLDLIFNVVFWAHLYRSSTWFNLVLAAPPGTR